MLPEKTDTRHSKPVTELGLYFPAQSACLESTENIEKVSGMKEQFKKFWGNHGELISNLFCWLVLYPFSIWLVHLGIGDSFKLSEPSTWFVYGFSGLFVMFAIMFIPLLIIQFGFLIYAYIYIGLKPIGMIFEGLKSKIQHDRRDAILCGILVLCCMGYLYPLLWLAFERGALPLINPMSWVWIIWWVFPAPVLMAAQIGLGFYIIWRIFKGIYDYFKPFVAH